jgi:RNA polymerase sigma-70 factor, ECF subfamily
VPNQQPFHLASEFVVLASALQEGSPVRRWQANGLIEQGTKHRRVYQAQGTVADWLGWVSILPAGRTDAGVLQPMPDDITKLLEAWKGGNADAGEELVAKTYRELRRIAHAHLRRERRGHTLQTTALLHEAYLRLLQRGPGTVENRDAFFRLMAAEMRRRLVDHARRRLASKRGGGIRHEPLEASAATASLEDSHEVETMLGRLDRALDELSGSFPRAARVVQLRFIAGLTTEETANAIGLSSGTVKREWIFARAWLAAALAPDV